MKNIAGLLERIDGFLVLAAAVNEHALIQAMDRATDADGNPAPQLGREAYNYLLDLMVKLQGERYYFDSIPEGTKWTVPFPKANLKAIVQKIREAGHPVLILKTFLASHMSETESQGLLSEFLKSLKSEKELVEVREKVKNARKLLKAIDLLLTKTFPISIESIKKSPAGTQKTLAPLVEASRGRPLYEDFVRSFKAKLEAELQKALQQLPARPDVGPESE